MFRDLSVWTERFSRIRTFFNPPRCFFPPPFLLFSRLFYELVSDVELDWTRPKGLVQFQTAKPLFPSGSLVSFRSLTPPFPPFLIYPPLSLAICTESVKPRNRPQIPFVGYFVKLWDLIGTLGVRGHPLRPLLSFSFPVFPSFFLCFPLYGPEVPVDKLTPPTMTFLLRPPVVRTFQIVGTPKCSLFLCPFFPSFFPPNVVLFSHRMPLRLHQSDFFPHRFCLHNFTNLSSSPARMSPFFHVRFLFLIDLSSASPRTFPPGSDLFPGEYDLPTGMPLAVRSDFSFICRLSRFCGHFDLCSGPVRPFFRMSEASRSSTPTFRTSFSILLRFPPPKARKWVSAAYGFSVLFSGRSLDFLFWDRLPPQAPRNAFEFLV